MSLIRPRRSERGVRFRQPRGGPRIAGVVIAIAARTAQREVEGEAEDRLALVSSLGPEGSLEGAPADESAGGLRMRITPDGRFYVYGARAALSELYLVEGLR